MTFLQCKAVLIQTQNDINGLLLMQVLSPAFMFKLLFFFFKLLFVNLKNLEFLESIRGDSKTAGLKRAELPLREW